MNIQTDKLSLFLNPLKQIYADMDHQYNAAADYYDFHCLGCEENCCLTRFYHHTFLEYHYILEGYQALLPEKQRAVKELALDVCQKTAELDKKNQRIRLMCPLNENGFCLLYDYRPMICRLHGISHELHRPDGQVIYGPGCEAFTQKSENRNYFPFDRTPFYVRMAKLERELKESFGITEKLKMTIAEMLTKQALL